MAEYISGKKNRVFHTMLFDLVLKDDTDSGHVRHFDNSCCKGVLLYNQYLSIYLSFFCGVGIPVIPNGLYDCFMWYLSTELLCDLYI